MEGSDLPEQEGSAAEIELRWKMMQQSLMRELGISTVEELEAWAEMEYQKMHNEENE